MPSQIILFSQPRTASHLLERMLTAQTNVELLEAPFSSGRWGQIQWLQKENYADGMEVAARAAFDAEMAKSVANWEERLSKAKEKGVILMVHFHAFFATPPDRIIEYIQQMAHPQSQPRAENFMSIPDKLLLEASTVPVFTIRDPRIIIPSACRTMNSMGLPSGAGRPNFLITTWQIWNRVLYDFYVSKGIDPVVLETDDYVSSEDFVRQVCSRIGLDPEQASLSWEPATAEEKEKTHPMYYASQSTLINSSGPDPAFSSNGRDLDKEQQQWEEEFGNDAVLMRELVELAMPHYLYLKERRMKIEDVRE